MKLNGVALVALLVLPRPHYCQSELKIPARLPWTTCPTRLCLPEVRRGPGGRAKLKIKNLLDMTDDDIVEMLGGDISPTRLKCATLSLKALKKALKQQNAKI